MIVASPGRFSEMRLSIVNDDKSFRVPHRNDKRPDLINVNKSTYKKILKIKVVLNIP